MTTVTYSTYTEEQLLHNINVAKITLIQHLQRKGLLSSAIADQYIREWFFIVRKPSWFAQAWRKLMKDADEDAMILAHVENLFPGPDYEEEPDNE